MSFSPKQWKTTIPVRNRPVYLRVEPGVSFFADRIPPLFEPERDRGSDTPGYLILIDGNCGEPCGQKAVYVHRRRLQVVRKGNRFTVFVRENHPELRQRYLEIGISISLMAILLEEGILTLHGAAAVKGERAFLFAGPSGSGKTTLSRFLQQRGWRILSDELVAVAKRDDTYRVFPGPRWGMHYFQPRFYDSGSWQSPGRSFLLRGIYLLGRHSRKGSRVQQIPPGEVAVKLLRAFFDARFTHSIGREYKIRAFSIASQLAMTFPGNWLEMDLNDPPRWRVKSLMTEVLQDGPVEGKSFALAVFPDALLVLRYRDYRLFMMHPSDLGAVRYLTETNGGFLASGEKMPVGPGKESLPPPDELKGIWRELNRSQPPAP